VTQVLDLSAVYARLRSACELAGGQGEWARVHGMTASHVSDVVNARIPPGPRILAALGLRRQVQYVDLRRGNAT
jgi:hypothetical protein